MAWMKECEVCGVEVIDDNLCADCRVILADLALSNYEAGHDYLNEVKKLSFEVKAQRIQNQLRMELEASKKCPTCGK